MSLSDGLIKMVESFVLNRSLIASGCYSFREGEALPSGLRGARQERGFWAGFVSLSFFSNRKMFGEGC